MLNPTQNAIKFFKADDFKKAFKIFKSFKINFTNEEKKYIQIASEYMSGNGSFYNQIGYDEKDVINKAKIIIIKKYNL